MACLTTHSSNDAHCWTRFTVSGYFGVGERGA